MSAPNSATAPSGPGTTSTFLRGINSECVDLIYRDPPCQSSKNYAAPIGSKAAGAAFKDTWTLDDVDEAWHGEIADRDPGLYATIGGAGLAHGASMKSYLIMMAVRLLEMKRVLKPTGSAYLHCDPTANAYLRTLMDAVFGPASFRNEIVWCYRKWSVAARQFTRNHDTVLFYSRERSGHTFNVEYVTSASCRTTGRTGIRCTGGRKGSATGASFTSRSATRPLITSSRSRRAGRTTSTTSSCFAGPATRRRGTATWRN